MASLHLQCVGGHCVGGCHQNGVVLVCKKHFAGLHTCLGCGGEGLASFAGRGLGFGGPCSRWPRGETRAQDCPVEQGSSGSSWTGPCRAATIPKSSWGPADSASVAGPGSPVEGLHSGRAASELYSPIWRRAWLPTCESLVLYSHLVKPQVSPLSLWLMSYWILVTAPSLQPWIGYAVCLQVTQNVSNTTTIFVQC